MKFYFSHSYRDQLVNAYFLRQMVDKKIDLWADQKSDTWCVAKLERYLSEVGGFISIIPRRESDTDSAGYSPYIGHELDLARRARVPRLLFVERDVLEMHGQRFPRDAIAFDSASPQRDEATHNAAIAEFLKTAARSARTSKKDRRKQQTAILIADFLPQLTDAGNHFGELLGRQGFSVRNVVLSDSTPVIDDVRIMESMWDSDLCVFLLGAEKSQAHIALAMAHAHGIPSMRFRYEDVANDCQPDLYGLIRCSSVDVLVREFGKQLRGFTEGFVQPVSMALTASVDDVVSRLATTRWDAEAGHLWTIADGRSLIRHVAVSDPLVGDRVSSINAALGLAGQQDRASDHRRCHAVYDRVKQLRMVYELEAQVGAQPGLQKIRTPDLIYQAKAATCLDLACLFAAMLECVSMHALILVVRKGSSLHALAGYRVKGEPAWAEPSLGTLRSAISWGDAVFFEVTGAVESATPVFMEEPEERQQKLLDFLTAEMVAKRIIESPEIELIHVLDVGVMRSLAI